MTDSAAFGFAFASRFFIRFTPANRIIGLRSAGERGLPNKAVRGFTSEIVYMNKDEPDMAINVIFSIVGSTFCQAGFYAFVLYQCTATSVSGTLGFLSSF
jgi:hypothetical protein